MELIEENISLKTNPSRVDDQMVKGILLAAKAEGRGQAIKTLEQAFKTRQPTPDQLFILANLYNAESDWPKARDAMIKLLSANAKHEKYHDYLAAFIGNLLNHDEMNEAELWLNRLVELKTHSFATVDRFARLQAKKNKSGEIVAAVKAYLEDKESRPANAAVRFSLASRLLSDVVKANPLLKDVISLEGGKVLFSCVDQTGKKESLLDLASFLANCQQLNKVLDYCENALKDLPPQQVIAVAVSAVAGNAASLKQVQRVESWVSAARQQTKADPVEWDAFLAVLKERQADYREAEVLYRKVLGRDPNNLVALNNLAFLLALEGQGPEAYALIQKAIDKVGPVGELLDSRAVILGAQGKLLEAERDLRESLVQDKSAYRLFHLVQVQKSAGKTKESLQNLREVVRLGLSDDILHPLEREKYHDLVMSMKK